MISIDDRHRDPRIGLCHPGERVRLGTAIGYAMEPEILMGRLVGIRHGVTPIETFVIRYYVPGDGWYPTGECRTTSPIGLVPWTGAIP